jgi:hypothetical protein
MNGTVGTIEKIDQGVLTVLLDKKHITVNTSFYNHIDHGYAATIHKSQGITVDRSYILASPFLDSHSTYVGMTRHREQVDLFWSNDEFANERELFRVLGRDRSKDVTLDYIEEPNYAQELKDIAATPIEKVKAEISKLLWNNKTPAEKRVAEFLSEYGPLKAEHEIAKDWYRVSTEESLRARLDKCLDDISKDKEAMGLIYEQNRELFKEIEHFQTPEKKATNFIREYELSKERYEFAINEDRPDDARLIREKFNKSMDSISGDKRAMELIQKRDKELFTKIEQHTRQQDQQQQRQLERVLEREMER